MLSSRIGLVEQTKSNTGDSQNDAKMQAMDQMKENIRAEMNLIISEKLGEERDRVDSKFLTFEQNLSEMKKLTSNLENLYKTCDELKAKSDELEKENCKKKF